MKLIIISGPPCSGKTTFIKKNYKNYNIISSDEEIHYIKENNKNLDNIKLHKLGLENVYKKIGENITNYIDTVYDGTNLTEKKRKNILNICEKYKVNYKIDIEGVNILIDFNNIYKNWIKRGKDIKIESMFFLFSIYSPIIKSEGFNKIQNINYEEKTKYNNLKRFIDDGIYNKKELLEENKDLKFLNDFWEKSGRNYFKEYNQKLEYLEELSIEDKLALLYSEVKYFYKDFILSTKMVYKVNYDEFIKSFFNNIVCNKIVILGLNKDKVYKSLIKIINIF